MTVHVNLLVCRYTNREVARRAEHVKGFRRTGFFRAAFLYCIVSEQLILPPFMMTKSGHVIVISQLAHNIKYIYIIWFSFIPNFPSFFINFFF